MDLCCVNFIRWYCWKKYFQGKIRGSLLISTIWEPLLYRVCTCSFFTFNILAKSNNNADFTLNWLLLQSWNVVCITSIHSFATKLSGFWQESCSQMQKQWDLRGNHPKLTGAIKQWDKLVLNSIFNRFNDYLWIKNGERHAQTWKIKIFLIFRAMCLDTDKPIKERCHQMINESNRWRTCCFKLCKRF